MRVLLSTIGSRGDVQPLVALGLPITPIGPAVRSPAKTATPAALPTPEQRRQMIESAVAAQFETITPAAHGCNIIVGATALQIATPSIAGKLGVPYVFAAYYPAVLPSPHHAPPVLAMLGDKPAPALTDYSPLWADDAQRLITVDQAANER